MKKSKNEPNQYIYFFANTTYLSYNEYVKIILTFSRLFDLL